MRILAVDDGGFSVWPPSKRKGKTLLVGMITLGVKIEKVLLARVSVDGLDVTAKIIDMVKNERAKPDSVFLASISYAGFNLVDIMQLYDQVRIPIIVANKEKPREGAVEAALFHHFPDWQERLKIIERAGKPMKLPIDGKTLYGYIVGISEEEVRKVLEKLVVFGNLPEPLRIAHILAGALSKC